MNARLALLDRLHAICRKMDLSYVGRIKWEDDRVIRSCLVEMRRGDASAWTRFLDYLRSHVDLAHGVRCILEDIGWCAGDIIDDDLVWRLTDEAPSLLDSDRDELLYLVFSHPSEAEPMQAPSRESPGEIMYVEEKPGLSGRARIGRVRRSASGKTLYYAGRKLRSLKGRGFKANYVDIETGLEFWVSRCRRDGNDTLYGGIIEIDDDARVEYWTTIRRLPENANVTRFRAAAKFPKR